MDKIFSVEYYRVPLKFHLKYLTHALTNMYSIETLKVKKKVKKLISVSKMVPWNILGVL